MEMLPPAPCAVVDGPLADEEDEDDQSVTSAALGIESSATSFTAPRHVLLELDDEGDLQTSAARAWVPVAALGAPATLAEYIRAATPFARPADGEDSSVEGGDLDGDGGTSPRADDDGGARTPSSRFWGVTWKREKKRWEARYLDADRNLRHIGYFDDEEEAAHAVNKAISDAGLEGQRRTNAVDATGALVPKYGHWRGRHRSAVVAPDPSRDPTKATSKFWGVTWDKRGRRWRAQYFDANGKSRSIGYFDTQEAAAHAVNAAIRRAGLEGKRHINPVVDGQLVPRALKARGHGAEYLSGRRRGRRDESPAAPYLSGRRRGRRDESPAAPSTRARRVRRAVDYADPDPDDDDEEDLELGPPDDDDGWD